MATTPVSLEEFAGYKLHQYCDNPSAYNVVNAGNLITHSIRQGSGTLR